MNVNWVKGRHNVRFGTDIYYQALNHTQPELSGGDSFGARGGFRFRSGPTQIRADRGATSTTPLRRSCSACRTDRPPASWSSAYTTRNWQYSLYVRDQWQVPPS